MIDTATLISILFEVGIIMMAVAVGYFWHQSQTWKKKCLKEEKRTEELQRRLEQIQNDKSE